MYGAQQNVSRVFESITCHVGQTVPRDTSNEGDISVAHCKTSQRATTNYHVTKTSRATDVTVSLYLLYSWHRLVTVLFS